jgi:hypothetical protein
MPSLIRALLLDCNIHGALCSTKTSVHRDDMHPVGGVQEGLQRARRGHEMDDGRDVVMSMRLVLGSLRDNYSRISDNYGDSLESCWAPAERMASQLVPRSAKRRVKLMIAMRQTTAKQV